MRDKIIPYDSNLKDRSRRLRKAGVLSEALLWLELRGRKVRGFDFHRQKPIGHYIVDFYCPRLMLAIEIDGSSHNEKLRADEERQKSLESLGVRMLRFKDQDVRKNMSGVIAVIESWIDENCRDR